MPSLHELPEPITMEMICLFNKLKVPMFEGGSDPLAYEEWLKKIGKLLEIMEYLERFNVHLATY